MVGGGDREREEEEAEKGGGWGVFYRAAVLIGDWRTICRRVTLAVSPLYFPVCPPCVVGSNHQHNGGWGGREARRACTEGG